jgi:type IV pilus assembly protein PilV
LRVHGFLGFTLIEVLISLFILSFILLGFGAMFLQTERNTYANYLYSIASQQIITMIERLHALGDADGLDNQIAIWNTQNKLLLPKSEGMVEGSYPSYTVTIYWGKKSFNCEVNCIRKAVTV